MIDLSKNPPTLRLQWQGEVSVKCTDCPDGSTDHEEIRIEGELVYASGKCHACNGTGTVEREIVVDVGPEILDQYGSILHDSAPWAHTERLTEVLRHLLTRYQNGEKIEGVEEYDKYRVRL